MKGYLKKIHPLVILLIFVLFLACHLIVGNPVSKVIAGVTFDRYIEENYPGCYYENHKYDFTCNGYSAIVYSHANPDMRIVIQTDTFGLNIKYDNYKEAVQEGKNTAERLANEYTSVINSILGNEICGYKVHNLSGFFADNSGSDRQYSLKYGPLIPGGEYDIYQISPTDGDIIMRVIAPGATMETAEQILVTAKQKLAENGIVFDTISLSLMADGMDGWPYIINLEKLPYSVFSHAEFSKIINGVHLSDDPQWSSAFNAIADSYSQIVQSADWSRIDGFDITEIKATLFIDYELSHKAYGKIMYADIDGIDLEDIDSDSYESYTDRDIIKFGNRVGQIAFYVTAAETDSLAAADIINQINNILKINGLENKLTNLVITAENNSTPCHYRNIPYRKELWTEKEISIHRVN